jgi:hypothetical protein
VVSVTDPYGRILGFLDQSYYFSFQVIQVVIYDNMTSLLFTVDLPFICRRFGSHLMHY